MHPFSPAALLLIAQIAHAAPAIDLEIATERGLQITAPHQWLQLFERIGITSVRIRGVQRGDVPAVENRGTPDRPRYHVVGILSSREQLRLPGGLFRPGDATRLKDYFDRLSADGDERLTAPRGHFGLTEKEMMAVLADLSQPINFATKGQPPLAAVEKLQANAQHRFAFEAAGERVLRDAKPIADELNGISAGTGLAIILRSYGFELRPEKPRGEPIVYRIVPAGVHATPSRAGKLGDFAQTAWPVGWETEKAPGELAPSLFEKLNAEIEGYTLKEALAAIGPRLKTPYFVDPVALAAHRMDPSAVQIKIARAQMTYKRLLDRILAQADLGGDLRADESGKVFLWIGQ
jgi:hypothetical protein